MQGIFDKYGLIMYLGKYTVYATVTLLLTYRIKRNCIANTKTLYCDSVTVLQQVEWAGCWAPIKDWLVGINLIDCVTSPLIRRLLAGLATPVSGLITDCQIVCIAPFTFYFAFCSRRVQGPDSSSDILIYLLLWCFHMHVKQRYIRIQCQQ